MSINVVSHSPSITEESLFVSPPNAVFSKNLDSPFNEARILTFSSPLPSDLDGNSSEYSLSTALQKAYASFQSAKGHLETLITERKKLTASLSSMPYTQKAWNIITWTTPEASILLQKLQPKIVEWLRYSDDLLNKYESLIALKEEKDANRGNMYALFGGREQFEALPVLDIGDREGNTDYIDFILPQEMTAPIMRGQDKIGRQFFTIRAGGKCQTFFERYSVDSIWAHAGFPIISFGQGHSDSNINSENYKQLKSLITNGTVIIPGWLEHSPSTTWTLE